MYPLYDSNSRKTNSYMYMCTQNDLLPKPAQRLRIKEYIHKIEPEVSLFHTAKRSPNIVIGLQNSLYSIPP